MQQQLRRYVQLLIDEQCSKADKTAISSQNDSMCSYGSQNLASLACQILQKLDCAAVIVAEPLHPFPAFLLRRTLPDSIMIVPHDSESLSSLHDIPLVRHCQDQSTLTDAICTALRKRKGCIVEGIGMVSQGALTVEQAYIAWSSLLHATTIKYLEDLLTAGPLLVEEKDVLNRYRINCLKPLSLTRFLFSAKAPVQPEKLLSEMSLAGKATVQLGLVDSFFGNISCRTEDTLYISQTSARLDELPGQIDALPFDESSTAGITASSELPAHRAIYKTAGCKVILHGHPRFPVILSFFAAMDKHTEIAMIGTIPVVSGEGGVGGLAESLSKAFSLTTAKAVIVRGHGVFALSDTGFGEAVAALVEVEHCCREFYFLRLAEQYQL